jgi:type II secretory pathway pseudopilin PulG
MKIMKLNPSPDRDNAFTLLELVVVMFLVFIMVGLFFPGPSHSKAKAVRINCASNLRQVGLAFRNWAGENGDRYPMQVQTNELGGPQFADAANSFRYFQVMSNELASPKIVICPADDKVGATNFTSDFNGNHISYFIGLDADGSWPQGFLTGDSNIEIDGKRGSGLMNIDTNQVVEWGKRVHNFAGNVGLSDGSVQQFSSSALRTALQHTGFATNRLLFP